MVHMVQHPRVVLTTLGPALPAPALTILPSDKGKGREPVVWRSVSATYFPQLTPILILLVKQVLLCPIPHVCVCGLSLWPPPCRCHEPGLAQGQRNCPTIAAVLFQFNKGVMRNKEVSMCLRASGAPCCQHMGKAAVTAGHRQEGAEAVPGSWRKAQFRNPCLRVTPCHAVVFGLCVCHTLIPRAGYSRGA